MKRLFVLPLVAVASLAASQSVKMSMNIAGMDAGTATIGIKATADGGLIGDMVMNFDVGGQKGSGKMRAVFTKTGRPKQVEQAFNFAGQAKSVVETYTGTHV